MVSQLLKPRPLWRFGWWATSCWTSTIIVRWRASLVLGTFRPVGWWVAQGSKSLYPWSDVCWFESQPWQSSCMSLGPGVRTLSPPSSLGVMWWLTLCCDPWARLDRKWDKFLCTCATANNGLLFLNHLQDQEGVLNSTVAQKEKSRPLLSDSKSHSLSTSMESKTFTSKTSLCSYNYWNELSPSISSLIAL